MAASTTISSKFQISLPKEVRERQKWRAGQKLVFVETGNGVMLVPVPTAEELFGIAKGADPEGYRDRKDRY
jgi:AbrB family looped-hinge helix DNA binding protein